MVHFDTNFLIDALVPGSSAEARLQAWLTGGEGLGISAIAAQPDTLLSPEMAASAEQSRFTDLYRGRNQSAHVALRRSAILLYAIARRLPNFRSSVDATFTKLP